MPQVPLCRQTGVTMKPMLCVQVGHMSLSTRTLHQVALRLPVLPGRRHLCGPGMCISVHMGVQVHVCFVCTRVHGTNCGQRCSSEFICVYICAYLCLHVLVCTYVHVYVCHANVWGCLFVVCACLCGMYMCVHVCVWCVYDYVWPAHVCELGRDSCDSSR